jgi:hypothetical protein
MRGKSMKNNKTLIIVCLVPALFITSCYLVLSPRKGEVFDTWETANKNFKIRVMARTEENTFPTPGGAYYVFQSATLESEQWQDVITFRHDDPIPIPHEQIRFINDEIAYVFIGWVYAVTSDSGRIWNSWDARKDLPDWECCNYKLIKEVNLSSEGSGSMIFNPIPQRSGEVPELYTNDYGKHWNIKK